MSFFVRRCPVVKKEIERGIGRVAQCRSTWKEIEDEWNNELALSGGDFSAADRAPGSIFFVGNATVILRTPGSRS